MPANDVFQSDQADVAPVLAVTIGSIPENRGE